MKLIEPMHDCKTALVFFITV